jgi:hypothetical protein
MLFLCNNNTHLLVLLDFISHKENDDLIHVFISFKSDNLLNQDFIDQLLVNDYVTIDIQSLHIHKNKRRNIRNKLLLIKKNYKKQSYDNVFFFTDTDIQNRLIIKLIRTKLSILIEEGIGLYQKDSLFSLKSLIRSTLFFLKTGFMFYLHPMEQGNRGLHDILICRYPKQLPKHKRFKHETVQFDSMYSNLVLDFFAKKSIKKSNIKIDAIFFGTPISETGFLKRTEELDLLRRTIKKFNKEGFSVYIKPHPREDFSKYNEFSDLLIHDFKQMIAEVLIRIIKPQYAISFSSSVLLNLSNTKNIYLYDCTKSDLPNKSFLKSLATDEKKYHPKSIDQIDLIPIKNNKIVTPRYLVSEIHNIVND